VVPTQEVGGLDTPCEDERMRQPDRADDVDALFLAADEH
jgi:hypothetical protein